MHRAFINLQSQYRPIAYSFSRTYRSLTRSNEQEIYQDYEKNIVLNQQDNIMKNYITLLPGVHMRSRHYEQ
jgi:hypothetical protein